ncbi:MAG: PIG-L family deacetylase, partial [Clostridia bacterium]|nr:PIG-L family deacetylase [Clostridia bacterium]
MKRVSLILALLLLLTVPRFTLAEEPTPTEPPEAQTAPTPVPSLSPSLQKPTAMNMTNAVTFDVELPLKRRLEQHILDKWVDECEGFGAGQMLAFSWETAPNVRQLCIQWEKLPGDTVIRFYNADGLLLGEDIFLARYDTVTAVPEGAAHAVLVAGSEGMSLARLALFGEGILPSPFFDWQDTPDTLDYLVIATHPDDDVLFMGSIVPIYGAERGYVGTVAFATSPNRLRITEALAGVWTSGSVYYPIFLGYPDISYQYWATHGQYFLQGDVTRSIVRMLRQRHPLVVFTQDIGGEYGHWQHIVVSKSVADAVKCAADPAYDPESAGLYGTWQVQKLYVHLWPENPLTLDIDTPLAAFGGKSAFRVAEAAFRMHMSQNGGRHEVHDKYSRYSIAHFGMAY